MSEDDNKYQPLFTVMIRRGNKVVKDIPTKMLVPYIEGKKLLRTDAISGDGVKWTRLDEHFQLAKYFKDDTSPKVLRDAPSPFPQEEEPELEEEGVCPSDDETPAVLPSRPPQLDDQLNELADLLKDLNQ
ncbi:MAG: hypothetical protein NPINA01_27790 [Nitrospinaceae bacterium]|nr:MAG: hypothetical protein NPINA01_27790 [Nitrospinaceae bacterium]